MVSTYNVPAGNISKCVMNFFLHTATTVMHLFMLQAAEVQLEWKVTEATEPLRNVDTGRKSIYYDRHIVITGQDWSYTTNEDVSVPQPRWKIVEWATCIAVSNFLFAIIC